VKGKIMKTKKEIEDKVHALIEMMRTADEHEDKIMHAKIRGAMAGLEWVIGEREILEDVILDRDK
jgi:hypothetical protein